MGAPKDHSSRNTTMIEFHITAWAAPSRKLEALLMHVFVNIEVCYTLVERENWIVPML